MLFGQFPLTFSWFFKYNEHIVLLQLGFTYRADDHFSLRIFFPPASSPEGRSIANCPERFHCRCFDNHQTVLKCSPGPEIDNWRKTHAGKVIPADRLGEETDFKVRHKDLLNVELYFHAGVKTHCTDVFHDRGIG